MTKLPMFLFALVIAGCGLIEDDEKSTEPTGEPGELTGEGTPGYHFTGRRQT